jgi:hypothetical protein
MAFNMIASGVNSEVSAARIALTIEGLNPETKATPDSSCLTGTLSDELIFQKTTLGTS